jgi:transcriptional regulator with XRE-family HTH domain
MFHGKLRFLREKSGKIQSELAEFLSVGRTTYTNYETGKTEPDLNTVKKIAEYFHVTVDYLLAGDKLPERPSEKDTGEIEDLLQKYEDELLQNDGLMFDGEPASPESIEKIISAMRIGMEMAKKEAKEKYTPKKYRKKSDEVGQ